MNAGRWLLYGLGFVAELLAWAGCGATAFVVLPDGGANTWQLAGLISGLVVVVWGVVMSPRANRWLPTVPYYIIKGIIYVWAAIAWALVLWWVALVFVALVAITEPALYRRRLEEGAARDA